MGALLWLNEEPVTVLSISLVTIFLFVLNRFVCPYMQSPMEREVEREQNGSQVMKTV